MPATSRYVRDPSFPANAYAAEKSQLMNYTRRPLWLLRGVDRAGNDFQIGHGPRTTAHLRTIREPACDDYLFLAGALLARGPEISQPVAPRTGR
jgi:hypothetical protein